MHVIGTAVFIGIHLAITARHVLDAVIGRFGARVAPGGIEVGGYSLRLYQVLPGPPHVYNIWNVFRAWTCPSDLAILHVGLDSTSAPGTGIQWRTPLLRMNPPPSGQKVLAFGYRESKITVSQGADGNPHIDLNDIGTVSIGEVGQIFPVRRDSSMLTFPCFEVCARFVHGMSGGLVIDEDGALCGLVSSGLDLDDPNAAVSEKSGSSSGDNGFRGLLEGRFRANHPLGENFVLRRAQMGVYFQPLEGQKVNSGEKRKMREARGPNWKLQLNREFRNELA
jgi:hypothetical protein